MSDIQSTWPDYQNLVELQPKVQEERRLDSFPKLSFPVGTLVVETWGRIDYVLTAWGLIDERKELKEEINLEVKQKEILRKIYQNLWENTPELKQSIESQTIKIFDVPWRDLVALSIDGKNVDYIYDRNWKEYFDFKWRRDDEMRYAAFKWATWIEEIIINWENYIIVDDKEYKVFTNEYFEVLTKKIEEFNEFWGFLKDVVSEMKKRWL